MSLIFYKFTCAHCRRSFQSPDVSGQYGEFVMRGEHSAIPALLQATEDPVYLETDEILDAIGAYHGHDEHERADIHQRAFGVTCDPAPDGTLPQIGRRERCPWCDFRGVETWEPVAPPRRYDGPVWLVEHHAWDRCSLADKQQVLAGAVARWTLGRR